MTQLSKAAEAAAAAEKREEKRRADQLCQQRLVQAAAGERKADLVLKNARIVNVYTSQILSGDIAIQDGTIAGIGSYEGETETDLEGRIVVPGLIDAHFHVESSMSVPSLLAPVLLQHGVCTVIADPHEIVNAAGTAGLDFMLEDAKNAALEYRFMIPSSVPSCDFEVNGAGFFDADQMKPYASRTDVLGLAEVMRMQDVLQSRKDMADKLDLFRNKVIDGHAPGLTGKSLQAYRAAGVDNDHEAESYEEALERLQNGFQLLIREGSGARNLKKILTGLLEHHIPLNRCSFCTDDKHIEDIFEEGTIDHAIRTAIALGCDPIEAVRMATLNTADHYGLHDRGAVAPGCVADLLVLDDLDTFSIHSVYRNGKKAETSPVQTAPLPESLRASVKLPDIQTEDIPEFSGWQDIIELLPGQLGTAHIRENLPEGACPSGDCSLLLAAERYGKTGEFALCPLKGYGLRQGAIAMSYAHDSHNVIAAADSAEDLLLALKTLQEIQGGMVLVEKGKVFDAIPMEAAGLMSLLPAEELTRRVRLMKEKAVEMGVQNGIDPFAHLSFLSLPVIPEIRLTPQGLYDVIQGRFIRQGSRKPSAAE